MKCCDHSMEVVVSPCAHVQRVLSSRSVCVSLCRVSVSQSSTLFGSYSESGHLGRCPSTQIYSISVLDRWRKVACIFVEDLTEIIYRGLKHTKLPAYPEASISECLCVSVFPGGSVDLDNYFWREVVIKHSVMLFVAGLQAWSDSQLPPLGSCQYASIWTDRYVYCYANNKHWHAIKELFSPPFLILKVKQSAIN